MASTPTLTEAELEAMGVDLAHPFSTTPRIKDAPFTGRIGEHRIARYADGSVSVWWGWYSPLQQKSREIAGQQFAAILTRKLKGAALLAPAAGSA